MKTILACFATCVLGAAIAHGPGASAQVKISSLPAASSLTGGELIPAVQGGGDVVLTPGSLLAFVDAGVIQGTPTPGHCASWFSTTALQDSGAACGGGGGGSPGGSSGQLQYNNASAFGGFTLAGDCTIAVPTITCLKTNGASFGTFATQNYATPPAIGGTAPAAGSFTTLSASTSITDSGLAASLPVCTNGAKVLTTSGCGLSAAVHSFPNGSNPAAFTNTSARMMGLASVDCTTPTSGVACFATEPIITPATTGRVLVTVTGLISNGTASHATTIQPYYGSGTPPVNQAATAGTTLGAPAAYLQLIGGSGQSFTQNAIITGLAVGTTYWVDLGAFANAGTSTMTAVSITLTEF